MKRVPLAALAASTTLACAPRGLVDPSKRDLLFARATSRRGE